MVMEGGGRKKKGSGDEEKSRERKGTRRFREHGQIQWQGDGDGGSDARLKSLVDEEELRDLSPSPEPPYPSLPPLFRIPAFSRRRFALPSSSPGGF
jgi:hypothetical protein